MLVLVNALLINKYRAVETPAISHHAHSCPRPVPVLLLKATQTPEMPINSCIYRYHQSILFILQLISQDHRPFSNLPHHDFPD